MSVSVETPAQRDGKQYSQTWQMTGCCSSQPSPRQSITKGITNSIQVVSYAMSLKVRCNKHNSNRGLTNATSKGFLTPTTFSPASCPTTGHCSNFPRCHATFRHLPPIALTCQLLDQEPLQAQRLAMTSLVSKLHCRRREPWATIRSRRRGDSCGLLSPSPSGGWRCPRRSIWCNSLCLGRRRDRRSRRCTFVMRGSTVLRHCQLLCCVCLSGFVSVVHL